jgi:transposase-like protein
MNVLPREKQVRIIGCLMEGNSIRSTERITDTHRDTVIRLGVKVGEACRNLHDHLMRDL